MNKTVIASKISEKTGLNKVLSPIYSGIGAIFMLHRVSDDQLELDNTLFTSPSFLDCYISYLKKMRIDIVNLKEAQNRIQLGNKNYFVCFSFDDGYKDNLTQAFPSFLKHDVPFSIYITKSMIDRTLFYWWRGIEHIFKENEEVSFVYSGRKFHFTNYTHVQRKKNYRDFMQIVHQDKVDLKKKIKPLFDKYRVDIQKLLETEALSENDIKMLASNTIVTLGSHGVSHNSLKSLSEDTVYYELAESRRFLEAITGKKIDHFAYPFGGPSEAGSREFEIAKKLGYSTATTTRKGTIKKAHKNYLQMLPRLSFNQDFESISWMELQRTGIMSQLKRKTLKPLFITEYS